MRQKSIEAANQQMEIWRAGIAETLGLQIDYVKPTQGYQIFEIYDERGYCERLVGADKHSAITYAYYPATYPLDFTTEAYSPSAMADIVKKELAWFLAEEPENLSCTVQDKELNAAEEEPEMLYIHCHNTATDRWYIAEIYYANEPKDIGRGLKSIERVEEVNDPAPSTP